MREFLQGLVTNDVSCNLPVYAALLSAQGKAMFDFFVWDGGDGALLLDCEADTADDLAKRLSLYRLRRKIEIVVDPRVQVRWELPQHQSGLIDSSPSGAATDQHTLFAADPRLRDLGYRLIVEATDDVVYADDAYLAHRLSLGIPEGRAELGDILWLETNAVELNGVSFEKGCYIGQENTARMNWRQKVNRRLVVVPLEASQDKRQKVAYPELGFAVDHLRVADLDPATLPEWQRAGIAD